MIVPVKKSLIRRKRFVSLVLLPTIYSWLDIIRHWPRKLVVWLARLMRPVFSGLAWPVRKVLRLRQSG